VREKSFFFKWILSYFIDSSENSSSSLISQLSLSGVASTILDHRLRSLLFSFFTCFANFLLLFFHFRQLHVHFVCIVFPYTLWRTFSYLYNLSQFKFVSNDNFYFIVTSNSSNNPRKALKYKLCPNSYLAISTCTMWYSDQAWCYVLSKVNLWNNWLIT